MHSLYNQGMTGMILQWLEMTAFRMDVPKLFSAFHITASLLTTLCAWLLSSLIRRMNRQHIIRIFFLSGILLLIMEVYKQAFMYFIEEGGHFNWWWFPFQLCSVPMYLVTALPFLSSKHQDTVFTFLSTYGLTASAAALIWPQDMLRSYVMMTGHAFIYHGFLLFFAFVCLRRHMIEHSFMPSLILFAACAGIAEVINFISHLAGGNADMFYISPFVKTLQPVFTQLEEISVPLETCVYLLCISLVSFLIQRTAVVKKKEINTI